MNAELRSEQQKPGAFNEGIALAVLPILGYAIAFAFEAGYASVFRYPIQFVRLDLVSVFVAVIALLGIVGYLYHFVDILVAIRPRPIGPISRELLPALPLVLAWLALVFIFGRDWYIWLWFGTLLVVLISLRLTIPFLTHWNVKGYRAKLEASYQVDRQLTFLGDLALQRFGFRLVGIGLVSMVLILFAAALGAAQAMKQDHFYVINANTNRPVAVLRIFGDIAVAAPFDPLMKRFQRDFHLINLTESETVLSERVLGRLRPVEVLGP